MTPNAKRSHGWRLPARACAVAVLLLRASAGWSAPPRTPIAAPLYSFDLLSPAVEQSFVNANDVLGLDFPYPLAVIPGAVLGLTHANDELDGLSGANALIGPSGSFVILFSVTRDTTGAVGPDPTLVALGVPYNVADQAARGHQAGDEFISTILYSLTGGPSDDEGNDVLARNNYDEGGSDLAARPETSAKSQVNEPQDNVDALADVTAASGPYFSASAASPSLATLPGSASPSGAHIFHSDLVSTTMFASYSDLGLQQDDDVDAIVVFDRNLNGVFDATDVVLFSLTPDSPSLDTTPGTSALGAAADVFLAEPGQPPQLFAAAATLGLGAAADDLDALDIAPCLNAAACSTEHGIRRVPGDLDDDGDVDADDQALFEDCYRGEGQPVPEGCESADLDGDSDVDCADWLLMLQAWTAPGYAPPMSQCLAVIPTVSHWGLLITALATLIAAAIVLRRQPTTGRASLGIQHPPVLPQTRR